MESTSASPLLRLENVTKTYTGVLAVDDATFSVSRGEVLGLVGKNGAGKSTLIKIMGGIVQPDTGRILVDGDPVEFRLPRDAQRAGIALVHQEMALAGGLTVAENVYLGLGYPRRGGLLLDRGRLAADTQKILDRLESGIDPRERIESLSIAHQRVVMIARALAQNARLLILDEPTASLTLNEIEHLHEVIRRLRSHDVAVIYVSHRLEEIFALTDRIVTMRDGAIVADQLHAETDMRRLVDTITGDSQAGSDADATPSRPHQAPDGPPLLSVRDLTVGKKVEGVSFDVRPGEVLGIAGMVGAGRSELLRAIFGAEPVTEGAIEVGGAPMSPSSPRDAIERGVVLLPEDRKGQGLLLDRSIRENVTLPSLSLHRWRRWLPFPSGRAEHATASRLMERLSVAASDDVRAAGTLSGGNQQKVVFAKWLVRDSRVMLLDEPTHGVDVGAKREIYELMRELADEGRAVVFVSSEFGELVGTCDRVLVMREGRLVNEFAGSAVSEDSLTRACYD